MRTGIWICAFICIGLSISKAYAQSPTNSQQPSQQLPTIDKYYPKSMLKVKKTNLNRCRFPAIDIHGHFGFRLKGDATGLDKYVEVMQRHSVALSITLDCKLGHEERHLSFLKKHDERFVYFCHIDFVGEGEVSEPETCACNQPGFVRQVCQQLDSAKQKGIVGLKFFKRFGLVYRNANGALIAIDDARFDPIWRKCAQLKLPVIIHTADPAAFFEPIDERNERYEELFRHPDWSFHGADFPSRQELLDARNRVIAKHPQTIFLGAHVANNSEDLKTVSKWLNAYPNLYVEIASRIGELGRQPNTARKFFLKHQDRILFGTDGPWPEERLEFYWRFLETDDEYFPYSEKTPQPQGLWYIYGLNLPESVLRKVYFENALKILPEIKTKYEQAAVNK